MNVPRGGARLQCKHSSAVLEPRGRTLEHGAGGRARSRAALRRAGGAGTDSSWELRAGDALAPPTPNLAVQVEEEGLHYNSEHEQTRGTRRTQLSSRSTLAEQRRWCGVPMEDARWAIPLAVAALALRLRLLTRAATAAGLLVGPVQPIPRLGLCSVRS